MINFINRMICFIKFHDFDDNKFKKDMGDHYSFERFRVLGRTEIIREYWDNPPKPFCKRCKREI
jgi:predicted sulfurtransferase